MRIWLTSEEMKILAKVSLGEAKADLVMAGADLVNVYSGELHRKFSVAVKDKWIAYVGPDASHTIGPDTEVMDLSGKTLVPGFIDGHAHMIYYASPHEFLRYAMKGGTTTIITEIMDMIYPSGYAGLVDWIDQLQNQPVKVFSTTPPSITFSREAEKKAPNLEQLMALLRRDEIVGVGEGFWQEILAKETNYPALSAEALSLKKSVEGHAAGCHAERLSAYAAFGVSSCHESVSAEEVLEKLRLGMCVMIREGSIRKELDAISKIKDMPLDFRRITLVSDGVDPRDLVEKGFMDHVVQRAIDVGFDPILAIQMATLNVAEHFRLDAVLGGIAPAKYADMLVLPDLQTIKAHYVISNGKVIVRGGELKVEPHMVNLSGSSNQKMDLKPSDFMIGAHGKNPITVRVIHQVTELVTKETVIDLYAKDGEVKADPDKDLLKASFISCEGTIFTGLIRGHGFQSGAMATSAVWENAGTVVVGVGEDDMAQAVNRVYEMGGGIVLVENGEIKAELELSLAGLMSSLTIEDTVQRLHTIQGKAEALGFRFPDAALTLATLTSPAIPFLRISEEGLMDVRKGQRVELFVS